MGTTSKPARRKGRAITIHEVAALAQVSPMTVSRVINGNANVREATREKVMRAVEQLGYTPNLAARSLAAAQGTRIALIYTNPSGAYLSEFLVGALRGAARTATQLVVDTWDGLGADGERAAARALAKNVSGVILPPPLCESRGVIAELTSAGVPVVALTSVAGRERFGFLDRQRRGADGQRPRTGLGDQHLRPGVVDVALTHQIAVGERRIELGVGGSGGVQRDHRHAPGAQIVEALAGAHHDHLGVADLAL